MVSLVAASIAVQGHGHGAVDHGLVSGRGGALGGELGLRLTAGRASMPMVGWIEGRARETLPMSVDPGPRAGLVDEAAPQGLGVALVQGGQLVVVAHLRVVPIRGQLQGRPGGQAPASKQRVTLSLTSASCSMVSARTIHSLVRPMMCWRSSPPW